MSFLDTIVADGEAALAEVKKGLTYLEHEGEVVLAWVEKEVPGSEAAIAAFLQTAEADAADLARHAASGLQTQISALLDSMQTELLNLIQSTHLATNDQAGLKAIDVSGVALLQTLVQKAGSVALAQLLAKLAPAT